MKMRCKVCGYVYDPATGDPANGLAPGTPFVELPAEWTCPVCGAGKGDFSEVSGETQLSGKAKEKIVLFAFRGDPMCFIHVLLNSLDLHERDLYGSIVIEGEAVKLIPKMSRTGHFLHPLYAVVKEKGLIAGVCRACSAKLGVTEAVEDEGLPFVADISGHPSMGKYIERGFRIITF